MTDESDPLDWFPHLRTWPDWTPSALWNGGLVPPAPRQVPARLAVNWEETPNGGAIAQPSPLWNRGNSHWMESLLPTPPSSGNGGLLGNLGAELDGPPWFNPGPELKSIMPWPAWMRPVVPEALLARPLTQSSTPPMPMSVPASGADGRYGPASTSASAPAASFSDAPDRVGSYSWQSVTAAPSLGASDTIPATPTQPTDDDPFATAAARVRQSVRPLHGRREGLATKFLERYVPHVAEGLIDLATLPGRAPVPMPQGLTMRDDGEWLVNGQPAAETAEGRAWLEDQQKRIDWGPAMALNMLTLGRVPGGAPPGAIGTFVGQKAAERLTQGGPHPAVDPARALTDREAIAALEARAQAGDPRDADVFARSGWFRAADGNLKKEIPDTGAKLVPTGKDNYYGQEYIWQHPAGDIHQIYDIPPITIGPRVTRDYGPGAATDLETGRIRIGADLATPEGSAYANRAIAEEIQHAIQAREGFAPGTNPANEVLYPDYWKILGQPFPSGRGAMKSLREHAEIIRRGIVHGEQHTPEFQAALAAYLRSAGEVEAKNAKKRLVEERYAQHPHETAEVAPSDQIVRDSALQRRIFRDAVRRGF